MGEYSCFELYGWRPDGSDLPVRVKREIQNKILDTGVDNFGTCCTTDNPYIMSFSDESYHAYDNVTEALSDYARLHQNVMMELYYECDESHRYRCMRFMGDKHEGYDRVELYPPFVELTFSGDKNEKGLPIIEFRLESQVCIPGESIESIYVMLDNCISECTLERLMDRVSSYINSDHDKGYEQLIHDVLSEEHIGHWIIRPKHTISV